MQQASADMCKVFTTIRRKSKGVWCRRHDREGAACRHHEHNATRALGSGRGVRVASAFRCFGFRLSCPAFQKAGGCAVTLALPGGSAPFSWRRDRGNQMGVCAFRVAVCLMRKLRVPSGGTGWMHWLIGGFQRQGCAKISNYNEFERGSALRSGLKAIWTGAVSGVYGLSTHSSTVPSSVERQTAVRNTFRGIERT